MDSKKKKIQGYIIFDSVDKTIMVKITTKKTHPRYGKKIVWSKKYLVHDVSNQGKIGDYVEIIESRPYSKRKRFELLNIISKVGSHK
jgi:small subunit ribosomal protein S17